MSLRIKLFSISQPQAPCSENDNKYVRTKTLYWTKVKKKQYTINKLRDTNNKFHQTDSDTQILLDFDQVRYWFLSMILIIKIKKDTTNIYKKKKMPRMFNLKPIYLARGQRFSA